MVYKSLKINLLVFLVFASFSFHAIGGETRISAPVNRENRLSASDILVHVYEYLDSEVPSINDLEIENSDTETWSLLSADLWRLQTPGTFGGLSPTYRLLPAKYYLIEILGVGRGLHMHSTWDTKLIKKKSPSEGAKCDPPIYQFFGNYGADDRKHRRAFLLTLPAEPRNAFSTVNFFEVPERLTEQTSDKSIIPYNFDEVVNDPSVHRSQLYLLY